MAQTHDISRYYDTSRNWKEIIKIVKRSEDMSENFLWQNIDGSRKIYGLTEIEVLEDSFSMVLHLSEAFPDINSEYTSYMKLGFRESVFKVKVIRVVHNLVTVLMPTEVKVKEARHTQRIKFRPKDDKRVRIVLKVDFIKASSQALNFQLIDISETGMSILCSDENLSLLKRADAALVDALGTLELHTKQQLEFIYAHKLRYRYKGQVHVGNRVGFKFATALNRSILDSFMMSFD